MIFRNIFPISAPPGFTYKGAYYPTHDNLIGRYQGADGIKTGYTGACGFNLASSVVRDGVHLIGMVMGGRTAVRRDLEMMHLLDTDFAADRRQSRPGGARARCPGRPWRRRRRRPPPPDFTLPPATQRRAIRRAVARRCRRCRRRLPPSRRRRRRRSAPRAGRKFRRHPCRSAATGHASRSRRSRSPRRRCRPLPAGAAPCREPAAAAPARSASARADPSAPAPGPMARRACRAAPRPADDARPRQLAKPARCRPACRGSAGPARRTSAKAMSISRRAPGHTWTIQIGAFADQALAKAQLDSLAAKAKDVVGQAARIVAPITSRQRPYALSRPLRPYAEREARDVCGQLTQRGQTCFAVVNALNADDPHRSHGARICAARWRLGATRRHRPGAHHGRAA